VGKPNLPFRSADYWVEKTSEQALERDKFMDGENAKAFGIIDQVVASRSAESKDK
jgi:ATP-dependent protease ClpP protease subunit